jgi:hypothetical protein
MSAAVETIDPKIGVDIGDRNGIDLGDLVRDTTNGFTGVATDVACWLNGCVNFHVKPTELGENQKILPAADVPAWSLVVEEKGRLAPPREVSYTSDIRLGQMAKDLLTGFEGCVEFLIFDIGGMVRVGIRPQKGIDNDGHQVPLGVFDLQQVQLLEEEKQLGTVRINPKRPAGPHDGERSLDRDIHAF